MPVNRFSIKAKIESWSPAVCDNGNQVAQLLRGRPAATDCVRTWDRRLARNARGRQLPAADRPERWPVLTKNSVFADILIVLREMALTPPLILLSSEPAAQLESGFVSYGRDWSCNYGSLDSQTAQPCRALRVNERGRIFHAQHRALKQSHRDSGSAPRSRARSHAADASSAARSRRTAPALARSRRCARRSREHVRVALSALSGWTFQAGFV